MPINAVARISNSNASRGAQVKAMMMKFDSGSAFLITSKGNYDFVAQSPQAKRAFARMAPGASVVSITGSVLRRGGTGVDGYKVTTLHSVGKLVSARSQVTKGADGKFYAGKIELKPMTPNVKQQLEAGAAAGRSYASGIRQGGTLEVWQVSIPMVLRPPVTVLPADAMVG